MIAKLLSCSLSLLAAAAASAPSRQGGGNNLPPQAAVIAREMYSSAFVTGAAPAAHACGPNASVAMGVGLTTVAQSALAPFDSIAGAQLTLGPGPVAPVRLALTTGAVNQGLGTPPFLPLYREGCVRVDATLTLGCKRGARWQVDAAAIVQPTWGAGIGCSQVQIDVGDDGVTEVTWGCMAPAQQQAMTGTAGDGGLRIRVRATGAARSWTTSTPDHFLLQLTIDCTPISAADYGFGQRGGLDLQSPVDCDAFGSRPSLAAREPDETPLRA